MNDRYQSTIPATTLGFAFIVLFALIAKAEPENEPATKITAEISGRPGGEEGETDTALVRDGKVIAVIKNAAPVGFSPDGTKLLLQEKAADDDLRHFVVFLDPLKEDIVVRRGARLGGRYVTRAGWSGNENIVLEYNPELSGKPPEILPVE